MKNHRVLETLEKELPPVVARKEVYRLTGGLISPRHLANLDSAGLGPKERIKIGRHVAYDRDLFIAWMSDRIEETNSDTKKKI